MSHLVIYKKQVFSKIARTFGIILYWRKALQQHKFLFIDISIGNMRHVILCKLRKLYIYIYICIHTCCLCIDCPKYQ